MINRGTSVATGFAVWALVAGGLVSEAAAQGNAKPPFSTMYSRPAVSPYLMLGTQNAGAGINGQTGAQMPLVYQQLIQPQLQQQQQQIEQNSQSRQLGRLQNQVRQIERNAPGGQAEATIRPTGHASTYLNFSHFYPQK